MSSFQVGPLPSKASLSDWCGDTILTILCAETLMINQSRRVSLHGSYMRSGQTSFYALYVSHHEHYLRLLDRTSSSVRAGGGALAGESLSQVITEDRLAGRALQ